MDTSRHLSHQWAGGHLERFHDIHKGGHQLLRLIASYSMSWQTAADKPSCRSEKLAETRGICRPSRAGPVSREAIPADWRAPRRPQQPYGKLLRRQQVLQNMWHGVPRALELPLQQSTGRHTFDAKTANANIQPRKRHKHKSRSPLQVLSNDRSHPKTS